MRGDDMRDKIWNDMFGRKRIWASTTKKHWLIFAIVMAAVIGLFILLDMAGIGSRHRPVPPPAMVYHSAHSIAWPGALPSFRVCGVFGQQ